MQFRSTAGLVVLALVSAAPLRAQKLIDVTDTLISRFLSGATAENAATSSVSDQLAAQDAKIKAFHDCESAFLAANNATSSAKLSFALKAAMRIKCGATSDDGLVKDKQKILDGPQDAAAKAGGFGKAADYVSLKNSILGFLRGDRSSFTPSAVTALSARQSALSSALGVAAVQQGAPSGGGGDAAAAAQAAAGAAMPAGAGMWTTQYTWLYINQQFAMQYSSGATTFEKPYQPGQWTTWQITISDQPDVQQTTERAFLAKTADGNEWWRMKTLTNRKDGGKIVVDTVILEALFKPVSDQMKQIVRMRGQLPGSPDPQELLVPAGSGMVATGGMMPFRPTPESIDGATVGTESVSTGSGSVTAKHVRFGGAGGGSIDWWLSDDVAGGWVKFSGGGGPGAGGRGGAKKGVYTMQMTGQGTGAVSVLGTKM